MSADPSAIPPKPNSAAISEMTKKTRAHFRIDDMAISFLLGRMVGKDTHHLVQTECHRPVTSLP